MFFFWNWSSFIKSQLSGVGGTFSCSLRRAAFPLLLSLSCIAFVVAGTIGPVVILAPGLVVVVVTGAVPLLPGLGLRGLSFRVPNRKGSLDQEETDRRGA